jgi:DNA-binding NarL/FixJ family response regulator
MRKIAVQLVDDQAVVRAGLKMLINAQQDMEVVGEAADASGAVRVARNRQPAVVLFEVGFPENNGAEVIGRILDAAPHARVLILSMYDDPVHMRRALERGAAGYVAKRATDTEVMTAIRTVARGQTYTQVSLSMSPAHGSTSYSPRIPASVKARLDSLSAREKDVLRFLALGYTSKETACRLDLAVKSVETYRYRMSKKLGAGGRKDLVRFAIDAELVTDAKHLLPEAGVQTPVAGEAPEM